MIDAAIAAGVKRSCPQNSALIFLTPRQRETPCIWVQVTSSNISRKKAAAKPGLSPIRLFRNGASWTGVLRRTSWSIEKWQPSYIRWWRISCSALLRLESVAKSCWSESLSTRTRRRTRCVCPGYAGLSEQDWLSRRRLRRERNGSLSQHLCGNLRRPPIALAKGQFTPAVLSSIFLVSIMGEGYGGVWKDG